MLIVSFVAGIAVGGLLIVVFSKNNKNTIAQLRADVLAVAHKGEEEIKKVVEKYKK